MTTLTSQKRPSSAQTNSPQPVQQPVFRPTGEILYRPESSGGYYALVQRGGKQFRRFLKTTEGKLADRFLPGKSGIFLETAGKLS